MKAGGRQVTMLKKMMISETSLRPRPYATAPSAPVGRLIIVSYQTWIWQVPTTTTNGRMHNRQVKKTVNRLLYCFSVLPSGGTG
jgi:hypothetical protein